MRQRSNLIVVVGLLALVVGAAIVFLVLQDDDDELADGVPVLYADGDIPAGTAGDAAVAQGLIKTREVEATERPATALTDASQLAGRSAQVAIPSGRILLSEQFNVPRTAIATVNIPEGKQAVALSLENVPGVAGFAGAGDRINVFAVAGERVTSQTPAGAPALQANRAAKLIAQNIEVLNVNGTTLAPTAGQPGAPGLIFLLAVTPTEAEKLIFNSSFQRLYFTLVPRGAQPVPATPGVDDNGSLTPEPGNPPAPA